MLTRLHHRLDTLEGWAMYILSHHLYLKYRRCLTIAAAFAADDAVVALGNTVVSCIWIGLYLFTKDPVLWRRLQNLARIWMRQKSRCHFRIHLEMKKSRKMTLSCSLFYPKASEVSIVFSIACWRVLSDYEPQKFSLHRLNGAVSRRWILL